MPLRIAQLPRASAVSRTAGMLRKPVPAFARFESTGSDEKVKGSVIGIDLGMSPPSPIPSHGAPI